MIENSMQLHHTPQNSLSTAYSCIKTLFALYCVQRGSLYHSVGAVVEMQDFRLYFF
jgi:hypothetical protein